MATRTTTKTPANNTRKAVTVPEKAPAKAAKAPVSKRTRTTSTEYWDISPAKAQELMYNNAVNRKIRSRTVASYAEDMKQGLWRETGEAIKISRTGQLLDGQHRLSAIIEADVTQELMVITGLPDEAQQLMDQGAVRSTTDVLSMEGFAYAALTGTVARWVLAAGEPSADFESLLKVKTSTARVLKTAKDHKDIAEAAKRGDSFRKGIPGSPTAICYAWLYMHRVDPLVCEEFFTGFVDMNFKALRDPRKAAIRALQRLDRDEVIRHGSKKATATVSVLTRCWNDYRKGEEVETYALRHKGDRIIPPVRPI